MSGTEEDFVLMQNEEQFHEQDEEEKKEPLKEPFWRVNWTSKSSPTNLKQLHGLLEENQGKLADLQKIKDKDVILLIGLTGSGKSTLMNYLLGCELEESFSEAGDPILIPKEGQQLKAKMGTGVEAETLVPSVFLLSNGLALVDCPGFEENRGSEYGVCAMITNQLVVQLAASVRVVLVLSQKAVAEKGSDFERLVNVLGKIFKNLDVVVPSMVFLLNKAPKGYKLNPHLKAKLKQFYQKNEKELNTEAERDKLTQGSEDKAKDNSKKIKTLKSNRLFLSLMQSKLDKMEILQLLDPSKRGLLINRFLDSKPVAKEQFCLEQHCDFQGFNYLMSVLSQSGFEQLRDRQEQQRAIQEKEEELFALKRDLPQYHKALDEAKKIHRKSLLQANSKAKQLEYAEAKRFLDKKEREISFNHEKRDHLNEEKKDCGQETLAKYWEEEADIDSDKGLMFLFGLAGLGLAVLAAPELSVGVVMAGSFGGSASGWLFSKIKKWATSNGFHYKGIPFSDPARIDTWLNERGWLEIEKLEPENGEYRASFYGNPFYRSKARVTIHVPIKNISANAKRLKEIPEELKKLSLEELKLKDEKLHLEADHDRRKAELKEVQKELEVLIETACSEEAKPGEKEVIVQELEEQIQGTRKKIDQISNELPQLTGELKRVEEDLATKKPMMEFVYTASVLIPEEARYQVDCFCAIYRNNEKRFTPLLESKQSNSVRQNLTPAFLEYEPISSSDPVRASALNVSLSPAPRVVLSASESVQSSHKKEDSAATRQKR